MPQRLSRGFHNHIADAKNRIFRTARCLPFKGAVLCESNFTGYFAATFVEMKKHLPSSKTTIYLNATASNNYSSSMNAKVIPV